MDWARHRRRKAAAKCHLRLDLHSFLPRFAIIDTARENDAKRSRELCAGIRPGEIVIFDKAYLDFTHLFDLFQRGVFRVTRAKDNMVCEVIDSLPASGRILRDEIVSLRHAAAFDHYPELMRRITALVEIDGREQELVFLYQPLAMEPRQRCRPIRLRSGQALYRCRWSLEAFFKQIKQTLQLADFLGHSANAVRWQIWTALLVYAAHLRPRHYLRLCAPAIPGFPPSLES